jgi:2-polyprenyl-6-methoxyphenol hydroxylase-like FAD-dependent oxidoreductase
MQNVDVLIIGGGPTGAMLALELAMQNVSFRIIDKEPVRSNKSRALVV